MSRRALPVIVALSMVLGACNSQLGQTTPSCDTDQINNSILRPLPGSDIR